MLVAEAIRNAQKLSGKKVVTGEDVRRGLETLNISDARWKEIGFQGFAAPISGVNCTDHNGHARPICSSGTAPSGSRFPTGSSP